MINDGCINLIQMVGQLAEMWRREGAYLSGREASDIFERAHLLRPAFDHKAVGRQARPYLLIQRDRKEQLWFMSLTA